MLIKITVALAILVVAGLMIVHSMIAPVGGDKTPVVVVIRKGQTAVPIGRTLAEKGLVRSASGFALIARLSGQASEIKPGAYKFNRTMTGGEMLDKMVKGEVAARWITIPEGYTLIQVADRLAEKGLVDRDEFLRVATSDGAGFSKLVKIPSSSLEGYLFPDTYLVMLDSGPKDIASQMLETFDERVKKPLNKDLTSFAAANTHGDKSDAMYRVLTVASMIEREAKVPEDRPLVSAVIWNRLRRGMKLEIDATVQYALGEHRSRLFYNDLKVESPYNTYRYPGLPPGPISNPGLASIQAAMHPAEVDYLYYVAKPDGSHVFSRTLDEHNAAKRRIRSGVQI